GPDTPVALLLERSPSLIIGMLGILKAGGAYLPLDPALPPDRLRFMLDDVAPAVILTEERLADRLPSLAIPRMLVDRVAGQVALHPDDHAPPCPARPESLAYILFTSGSTGRPKAVMVPHRAISHHTQWIRSLQTLGAGDTILQKTPATFDPSGLEIYLALTTGARLLLARPGGEHDLEYVLGVMQRQRVTMVVFIPSALAASVNLTGFAEACAALRLIICGGEVLSAELANQTKVAAPEARMFNLYGPTEATIAATVWEVVGDQSSGPLPIGHPIPDVRAFVFDRHGEPVPIGVPGELCLAGVQTAIGYFNRSDLTAEKFQPDLSGHSSAGLMYQTGDRVRWRRDGALDFLGRFDSQVKLRGYRIEPDEIAAIIATHDAVREAVVMVREDSPGHQRLVAYVTVAEGQQPPSVIELRDVARRALPAYMVPSAVMILAEFPLGPNGKIDRTLLPIPPDMGVGVEFVAPRTETERVIADIWGEVLGADRIGVHDDFFDLGGHSLLALRMFSRLVDRVQVRLPLRAIFEAPTVARLAERVVSTPEGSSDPDLPIPRLPGDEGPASFAQEVLWLLQRTDSDLSAYNMADAWWIEGRLDVGVLRRALGLLVARHEAFRTTFHAGESGPVQRIGAGSDLPVEVIDLRNLAAPGRQAEAAAVARSRSRVPFDLATDRLLRATLIRVADDEY
ncbi:MAG: amino acid adenylation domain-containing protein, partial [Gemmatimonadales bacterium]